MGILSFPEVPWGGGSETKVPGMSSQVHTPGTPAPCKHKYLASAPNYGKIGLSLIPSHIQCPKWSSLEKTSRQASGKLQQWASTLALRGLCVSSWVATDLKDSLGWVLEMRPLGFFMGLTFSGSCNLALGEE